MFRYKLLIFIGLVLATLVPLASTAANITRGIDGEGDHYLILDGIIIPGDAAKLANEIEAANAAGYGLMRCGSTRREGTSGKRFRWPLWFVPLEAWPRRFLNGRRACQPVSGSLLEAGANTSILRPIR